MKDSIWDEHGELRRGCTVREVLAYLVDCGGHSAGESVCVNGVQYRAGRLLYGPERPAVADRPIAHICDGYFRQLNFRV
jgi:hypothetical protein